MWSLHANCVNSSSCPQSLLYPLIRSPAYSLSSFKFIALPAYSVSLFSQPHTHPLCTVSSTGLSQLLETQWRNKRQKNIYRHEDRASPSPHHHTQNTESQRSMRTAHTRHHHLVQLHIQTVTTSLVGRWCLAHTHALTSFFLLQKVCHEGMLLTPFSILYSSKRKARLCIRLLFTEECEAETLQEHVVVTPWSYLSFSSMLII